MTVMIVLLQMITTQVKMIAAYVTVAMQTRIVMVTVLVLLKKTVAANVLVVTPDMKLAVI